MRDGNSFLLSPVIAGVMKWGSWGARFSTQEYFSLIQQCIESDISSFDHADIYGQYTTEEEFGNALALQPSLRSKIQIITKCGIKMLSPNRPLYQIKSYNTSKKHIQFSVENSLRNLKTDYIDFLLIHRPDPLMNPDEIAETISALKQQGKILHFGVSNFTPTQVQMLMSRIPVETNQIEISVLKLDSFTNGTLDQCIEKNIVPMAWSPLGGGNLFSREDERTLRVLATAQYLADKYEATPTKILLSWLLKHPAKIIPVIGSSKIDRIVAAKEAMNIQLLREEWFMLWRASTGNEVA